MDLNLQKLIQFTNIYAHLSLIVHQNRPNDVGKTIAMKTILLLLREDM